MEVSWNGGTLKSSILIGVSFINHPFWVPHLWKHHIYVHHIFHHPYIWIIEICRNIYIYIHTYTYIYIYIISPHFLHLVFILQPPTQLSVARSEVCRLRERLGHMAKARKTLKRRVQALSVEPKEVPLGNGGMGVVKCLRFCDGWHVAVK